MFIYVHVYALFVCFYDSLFFVVVHLNNHPSHHPLIVVHILIKIPLIVVHIFIKIQIILVAAAEYNTYHELLSEIITILHIFKSFYFLHTIFI